GDVNGDGRADLITGAGPGGGPHVRAFSGLDHSELASFFAYPASFAGGVFVAWQGTADSGAPQLVAGLINDTGVSDHDGITFDNTINGSVLDLGRVASLHATFG